MNEFRLEQHIFEDIAQKKINYKIGANNFIQKFKNRLPQELFINLEHEAGLAEMYRKDRQLLKYATHMFRQIEAVFNELYEIDWSSSSKEKIEEKTKLLKEIISRIDETKIVSIDYEFFSKVDNLKCEIDNSEEIRIFNSNDRIGKISGFKWNPNQSNIIAKTTKYTYRCKNDSDQIKINKIVSQGTDDAVEILKKLIEEKSQKHLNMGQQEKIYKWSLYFNGHNTKGIREEVLGEINPKPQLNAFISIKHYRDLAQHNIPGKRSIEQSFITSLGKNKGLKNGIIPGTNEDKKYHKNPELLLSDDSNYYERYVDTVIALYADLRQAVLG